MKINIEIEYLTPEMVNFHIRENDVHYGQDAVFFFKMMAEALFKTGIQAILANLKKCKSARHIRLFAKQCGMTAIQENESTIIYCLRRVE